MTYLLTQAKSLVVLSDRQVALPEPCETAVNKNIFFFEPPVRLDYDINLKVEEIQKYETRLGTTKLPPSLAPSLAPGIYQVQNARQGVTRSHLE